MLSDHFAKTFREKHRQVLEALLADDGGATLSSETSERLLKAGLNLIQRTNEVRWRLIVAPESPTNQGRKK